LGGRLSHTQGSLIRGQSEAERDVFQSARATRDRCRSKFATGTSIATSVFWLYRPKTFQIKELVVKLLFIIATDDAETTYNAVRLANVAVKKGDDVNMFMLGKGVLFERNSNEKFNVMAQLEKFEGDFYV
jgi:uncharacterized protein involved in oxidation of intracellular sulfur